MLHSPQAILGAGMLGVANTIWWQAEARQADKESVLEQLDVPMDYTSALE